MTQFTSWPFAGTGFPTARKQPDRVADIYNPKEFGALGNWNGSTGNDDTAAIQAMFNQPFNAGQRPGQDGIYLGKFVFPPGTYLVTAPITLGLGYNGAFSFIIEGCAKASFITGNFNGFIFDRNSNNAASGICIFRDLSIFNADQTGFTTNATFTGTISGGGTVLTVSGVSGAIAAGQQVLGSGQAAWPTRPGGSQSPTMISSGSGTSWVTTNGTNAGPASMSSITNGTSGCVRLNGTVQGGFENCYLQGMIPVRADGATFNPHFLGCQIEGPGANFTGSIGLMVGGASIISCDIVGFDNAIRLWSGTGIIHDLDMEENNTGIMVGADINGGSSKVGGYSIKGVNFEACGTGIFVFTANDCSFEDIGCLGEHSQENIDLLAGSMYGLRVRQADNCTFSNISFNGTFSVTTIQFEAGLNGAKFVCVSGANNSNININIKEGSTVNPGDTISTTFTGASITGSPVTVTSAALSGGDNDQAIAVKVSNSINANSALSAAGVSSTTDGNGTVIVSGVGQGVPGAPNIIISGMVVNGSDNEQPAFGSGFVWNYNSQNMSNTEFDLCNIPLTGLDVPFASLPANPCIGQMALINNCNTTTVGAAANGSGSSKVWVIWGGATWRVDIQP